MSYLRTLQNQSQQTNSNVVIARMVKNNGNLFMNDEDLRTLLKLRRNRMRIDTLNQDLLEDEIEVPENPEVNDEIIENLKTINDLLDNVRAGLAEV